MAAQLSGDFPAAPHASLRHGRPIGGPGASRCEAWRATTSRPRPRRRPWRGRRSGTNVARAARQPRGGPPHIVAWSRPLVCRLVLMDRVGSSTRPLRQVDQRVVRGGPEARSVGRLQTWPEMGPRGSEFVPNVGIVVGPFMRKEVDVWGCEDSVLHKWHHFCGDCERRLECVEGCRCCSGYSSLMSLTSALFLTCELKRTLSQYERRGTNNSVHGFEKLEQHRPNKVATCSRICVVAQPGKAYLKHPTHCKAVECLTAKLDFMILRRTCVGCDVPNSLATDPPPHLKKQSHSPRSDLGPWQP